MLAERGQRPFDSSAYFFEVMWDGVRALAFYEDGALRLQDRYQRDVTALYPELQETVSQVDDATVLDGVIVVLVGDNLPDFALLRQRAAARDAAEARALAEKAPVTFQAFDVLCREGRSLMAQPLWRRRRLMHTVRPGGALATPGVLANQGVALFEAARQHGLEGIMAKRRDSLYLPGRRSDAWLKIKVHEREEFVIAGFTYGGRRLGDRRTREPFASLVLGRFDGRGALRYVGEVSGGFDKPSTRQIADALDPLVTGACPFREEPRFQRLVFWCRPELVATVRFGAWTAEGTLQFPVFEGLRPDVPAAGLPGRARRAG
jgi:bifunctional non-homologous end joining protein LigD